MPYYDGHEEIIGVSGANPTVVPRNRVTRSVNRQFRFDENRTRPSIRSLELDFLDDDRTGNNKKLFEGGNVQGAYFYNSYPSFLTPFLVVSIAGTIFTVEIRGRRGYVRKLFQGNFPTLLHAWFAQGFEWLVIQDGSSRPILWNGIDPARRAVAGEVPIGSVMAFIHGRFVVCSSDGTNQVAVGDIVYGSDATNTNDIIKFTETTYWAEGGAFGAPLFIGDVQLMAPMPYLDTGTGQNELVIVGTEGGCSLDLSGPRETWKDRSVLRVSQLGGGGVSSHGWCLLNGDLIFRSSEGVRSYRNARTEFSQQWNCTPISTDVRRYMGTNSGRYGQFCPMVSWNNQVLVGVSPMIAPPNNPQAGFHRYHRGIVVLDAQPQSNTARSGFSVWQGLWTGIRPTAFAEGRVDDTHRCFAFSYDQDGVNRIYEFTNDQDDDWFGKERRNITSDYDTGLLGAVAGQSTNFDLKLLEGGVIDLSNLRSKVGVEVSYAPDAFQCFIPLHSVTVGCECVTQPGCLVSTDAGAERRYMPGAKSNPIPGTCTPGDKMFNLQARVGLTGSANVERMRLKFTQQPIAETVDCRPTQCFPTACCPYEHEFSYQIAPEGENTEVPKVAPPDIP